VIGRKYPDAADCKQELDELCTSALTKFRRCSRSCPVSFNQQRCRRQSRPVRASNQQQLWQHHMRPRCSKVDDVPSQQQRLRRRTGGGCTSGVKSQRSDLPITRCRMPTIILLDFNKNNANRLKCDSYCRQHIWLSYVFMNYAALIIRDVID